MRLRSLDLIGAGVIAELTLVVALLGVATGANEFSSWYLPFGILMVLFVPGYVLTLSILPELDRATTLLLSMGISISMNIMGGLILNYTPWGLHPFSWAIWLSSISLAGCIIATYRRGRLTRAAITKSATPKWNKKVVASFLLTGALLVTSILIARNAMIEAGTTFTQLWAVPEMDKDGYTVQIGIRNQEADTIKYELFVESRGTEIEHWTNIALAPGETWTMSMPLMEKPQYRIRFLLYKMDTPDKVYRTVHLAPASFNEIVSSPAGR